MVDWTAGEIFHETPSLGYRRDKSHKKENRIFPSDHRVKCIRLLNFLLDNASALSCVLDRIHVRRTDKIKEAQYFELESYMTHAEQWYDCPSSKNMTKKVYLASDDFKVLDEAKLK